jgi:transcription elongation GreA/GreB family factor
MSRGLPEIGDVLVTTEAPMGNVAQINRLDVALAQRVIKFRAKPKVITNDYLKYYLLSEKFQRILDEKSTGGTVKGIKGSTLHKMVLISPPLPEQTAIANCLSTWDQAIAAQTHLIAQKELRKKALMQQLLSGKKRLKGFSDKWKVKALNELLVYTPREVEKPQIPFLALGLRSHGKGVFHKYDFDPKSIAMDKLYVVKENDLEHAGIDIPERPISDKPNYVTPNGLKLLNTQIDALEIEREALKNKKDDPIAKQKLAIVERDMRYYAARIESAILTAPKKEDHSIVLFGAKVTVEDEEGQLNTYEIVGEDEADIHKGKVSYLSPLAEALIGAKLNDEVTWEKPMGDSHLTIQKIEY